MEQAVWCAFGMVAGVIAGLVFATLAVVGWLIWEQRQWVER